MGRPPVVIARSRLRPQTHSESLITVRAALKRALAIRRDAEFRWSSCARPSRDLKQTVGREFAAAGLPERADGSCPDRRLRELPLHMRNLQDDMDAVGHGRATTAAVRTR